MTAEKFLEGKGYGDSLHAFQQLMDDYSIKMREMHQKLGRGEETTEEERLALWDARKKLTFVFMEALDHSPKAVTVEA